MRESIPPKKKGDILYHEEVNILARTMGVFGRRRPGSNLMGRHVGNTSYSEAPFPPWTQYIAEITNQQIDDADDTYSGFYLCKVRYWNSGDSKWYSQDKEWDLDACGLELKLDVGDKLVVWWDEQRGMFVPAWYSDQPSIIDTRDSHSGSIASTQEGESASEVLPASTIRYALEISGDGDTNWQVVNQRIGYLNGNVHTIPESPSPEADHVANVSGCAIYTFRLQQPVWIRLRAETDIEASDSEALDLTVDKAGVRLEAKKNEGVQHSLGAQLSADATTVTGWNLEAAVNNDAVAHKFPAYESLGDGRIKISSPLDFDGNSETWTIEAEVFVCFKITGKTNSTTLELYELTSLMTLDDDVREFKAQGKPVVGQWCTVDGDGHFVAAAAEGDPGAVFRYRVDSGAVDEDLWLPTAFRDANDEAQGLATYYTGQRVYTQMRKGRREIISPPLDVWRFEMHEALVCGGNAEVQLINWTALDAYHQSGIMFTVFDWQQMFSKMATPEGDRGAFGYAKYFGEFNSWEIQFMETPGDFFGELESALATTDKTVSVVAVAAFPDSINPLDEVGGVLRNFNPFQANFGNSITVYNPVGAIDDYWFAALDGSRVLCKWDVINARYWIIAVEPKGIAGALQW